MSLPHETLLDLMALADGELEGGERVRVERLVAESDEARRVVETMRSPAIGAFLADEVSARADAAADGIADAVMARLEAEAGAAETSSARAVRLGDARARRSMRGPALGGITAALALAAGLALYVRSGAGDGRAPVASAGEPALPAPAAVAQRPAQGVEVDDVDSPSRAISVFEIPLGAGAARAAGPSSVVIMIQDDPGAK